MDNDLRRSASIRRPPSCHVTCKNKNRVGHSPTGKKENMFATINKGAVYAYCVTAPNNLPGPTNPWALHMRPPYRHVAPTRAPTWTVCVASCHALAPLALRAGHTRPATWPQRHVVTARWTRAPRQPVAWARSPRQLRGKPTPIFLPFLIKKILKNSIKNQIKIRENSIKIQKFIFLKIQLLFNPNFLHWITNSFLFNIMSFKICFQEGNNDELKFH